MRTVDTYADILGYQGNFALQRDKETMHNKSLLVKAMTDSSVFRP